MTTITESDFVDAAGIIRDALKSADPIAVLFDLEFSAADIAKWLGVSERLIWMWKAGSRSIPKVRMYNLFKLIVWHGTQVKAMERTLAWREKRGDFPTNTREEARAWFSDPKNQEYAEKQRQILADAAIELLLAMEKQVQSGGSVVVQ